MAEDFWYCYLLECSDETLYTGITNDLEKRMQAHKSGRGSKYVRARGFGRLLHAILCDDKSAAAKMEYAVKQLERNEKVTYFCQHDDAVF